MTAASSPDRRALLARLRAEQGLARPDSTAERQPRPDLVPLSSVQELVWAIQQYMPESTAYNTRWVLRLRGPLDVSSLRRALDALAARHETLRSTIELRDGVPAQQVHPPAAFPLAQLDLRQHGPSDRDAELAAMLTAEAGRAWRLDRDRPGATLVRLDEAEYVLTLSTHHVWSDGWSRGVFYRELAELYAAACEGRAAALPELSAQYADFAVTERARQESPAGQRQVAYWRERLAGAPPPLEIPVDRPRAADAGMAAAMERAVFPAPLLAALRTRARERGDTLYMLLLAALKVLLLRYTGERDLLVVSPVANRNRPELEPLIGCFASALMFRTTLDPVMSFADAVAAVRETTLQAFDNQDVPYERVLRDMGAEAGAAPVSVMFALQNTPPAQPAMAGLVVEEIASASADAKVELKVSCRETEQGLAVALEYLPALFDAATIRRVLAHYRILLEALAADPATPISAVDLRDADERAAMAAWNDTAHAVPDLSLGELISAQVERTPDAVAIEQGEVALTFAELLAAADRLAGHLAAAGVGPGDRVAICLERSPALLVALLAVLRRGAAYVPLDPDYPVERLEFMLADSGACVLLVQDATRDEAPSSENVQLLGIETLLRTPAAAARADVPPSAAAYVIYTSGSTGRPKGVIVPHSAVVNYLAWMRASYGMSPTDAILQKAPISFDVSVWELFLPIVSGARLVLAPGRATPEPAALVETIQRHGVTIVQFVPSQLRLVLEHGGLAACRTLRRVFCGGEALTSDLLAAVRKARPGVGVTNLYGPTETTIFSTAWDVDGDTPSAPILIGRPIWNTTTRVADERGSPCPVGVIGEIRIAGQGVALGYHARPELTADRFVPAPPESGSAREYRTGDLGRWRTDGQLECFGRADGQIKLRGHRIELGEVEATLLDQPGVASAVALVREERVGDARLVAWVVPAPGAELQMDRLREALRARLPEYMVPAAIVQMTTLPLSPSGKLDRRALPASEAPASTTYVAPDGELETNIADLMAGILGVERVGRADGFFDAGGHSLLAMRMLGQIERMTGVRLTVRDMFGMPTVAGLAALVGARREGAPSARAPVARRENPSDTAPLSWQQEVLWMLESLNPGLVAYNLPELFRLDGPLDIAALQGALDALVARHEALRTVVVDGPAGPGQAIRRARTVELSVTDLRNDAGDTAHAAVTMLRRRSLEPFDLRRDQLLRAQLVRTGKHEHFFLLESHHIAIDGWSRSVLMRELAALYRGYASGCPAQLSPPSLQAADYAGWQRAAATEAALAGSVDWWRTRLAGAPVQLELPTDFTRPAFPTGPGGRVVRTVPLEVLVGLQALAREHGATLFMVLLAAYDVLLFRYSGQDDIVVGAPVAGRDRPELAETVGYLTNTLMLRTSLAGGPSFSELLRRTRATCTEAYEHQEVPLERVISALRKEGQESPRLQCLLVLQNTQATGLELDGVTVSRRDLNRDVAKFDVSVAATEQPAGLRLALEFRSDVFAADTAARMLDHLVHLLQGVIATPDRAVTQLPLLEPAERDAILTRWNDTDASYPTGATIHSLIDAQARRRPDAIAVECTEGGGTTRLSYAELVRRANRVANALVALGVGRDERVALCLERSADAVVGILGILKAGAAYLPLDPAYPDDRLAHTLADAGAEVLLTDDAQILRLARLSPRVRCVRVAEIAARGSAEDPAVAVASADLAYVIYTSGSTGQPKGVMIEHRNVTRLLVNDRFQFDFNEADVWSVFHSFAFDFSVWELFGALTSGGRAVIVPRHVAQSPIDFAAMLSASGVTVLNQVPSAFEALLEAVRGRIPSLAVRYVIFGGEALHPGALREWRQAHPGCRLINMFGITETTVHVTFKDIGDAEIAAGVSNIGRPIPTLTVHVLDAELEPVPLGVIGEICVGGLGVARGYLNRPELTAERFVPDPFGPGGRLYRSGDLGRRLASGDIEYIGRRDDQVKVRGFRIELGEIEAVLQSHAAVGACRVIAREDTSGDLRLVAYLVLAADIVLPTLAELRAFAATRLPEHMVPAAFVPIEKVPVTANGKLDRTALPAPAAVVPPVTDAPRTASERRLAAIWCEVLGVAAVGIHDSFFELGGHSLLAMRVLTRWAAASGVRIPLPTFFSSPTIADLAAVAGRRSGVSEAEVALESGRSEAPLTAIQELLWHLDRATPGVAAYHVHEAVRLRGALDVTALRRALDALIQRHAALRTVFVEEDGRPIQQVRAAEGLPLREVDLRDVPAAGRETEAGRQMADEVRRPFDLARGPVIRALMLTLGADDVVLVLTCHHIVSDGWSQGVIRRELSALYDAATTGTDARLPALPVSYADFAAWQHDRATGPDQAQRLGYWRERLAGAPTLDLPTDRPRPAAPSFDGASVTGTIPAALVHELRRYAQAHDATLFMVLAAGLQTLFHRYTGQDDIVIGAPVAGRDRAELEGVVGYFAGTVALRNSLAGDPDFTTLLARVRDTCLGAYEHQDVPFERLGVELRVLFALQNMEASPIRLAGLDVTPMRASLGGAKFDLTLSMIEGPDGITASLTYRTDLFDAATAERILGHLNVALAAATRTPSLPVSRLPLLTEAEVASLRAWNDTTTAPPPEKTLPEMIAAQARATPHAVAVEFAGTQLTFADLTGRAARLAAYLSARGIGPGSFVGVYMDRSLDMMVALVGVLGAGAAYVPLDPDYPAERVAAMITDAAPALILTQAALRSALDATTLHKAVPVLCLDTEWPSVSAAAGSATPARATPDALAYMIYTSGSTGRPKGVMIPHRAVVNYLNWMRGAFALTAADAVLQKAPISFDASVWELYLPLVTGARLVLAPPDGHRDPDVLLRTVADRGVTVIQFVPSLLAALVDHPEFGERCSGLHTVVCGGEALPLDLASRVATLLPQAALHNLYGPTETTVYSTAWRHHAAAASGAGPAPLGRPIANTQVHVLDQRLQPVPAGVPGEICIGGAGVAVGYLNRPELTAERFVADPYGPAPERTLYRTGDLGRLRADGTLQYLGRIDHQVKIRGFRVELGEIESALVETAEVTQAAAVVLEPRPGVRELVAYYVPRSPDAPPPAALLARLRARLPSYMVPAALVPLAALPLSPNGKLDRAALPMPTIAPVVARQYIAPRTPAEAAIAEAWTELLGVERVSVDDDFFQLGGNSLSAIRVITRLRQRLGVALTLRTVFDAPTLAHLAAHLEADGAGRGQPSLADLLADLDGLTDEEATRLLRVEQSGTGGA